MLAKTTEGNDVDVYHRIRRLSSSLHLMRASCSKLCWQGEIVVVVPTGDCHGCDKRPGSITDHRSDRSSRKLKVVISNHPSRRLSVMNLAFRDADGSFTAVYDLTTTGAEGGIVAALAGGYHVRYGEISG